MDTDGEEPSRNLRAALRAAKDLKKRYLFIDIVSINQDLKSDNLIAAIMEYSDLYTYVQVIGAYEHEGARVNENMLRPWIVHEYSLLHKNPNSTVLVCHQNTKSFSTTEASLWTQRSLIRETLERQVAEGSDLQFALAALLVLTGRVSMAEVSDFQYLLPHFGFVIRKLYTSMQRNDYLLSIALLVETSTQLVDIHELHRLEVLDFELYTVATGPFPGSKIIKIGSKAVALMYSTVLDPNKDRRSAILERAGLPADILPDKSPLPCGSTIPAIHHEPRFDGVVVNLEILQSHGEEINSMHKEARPRRNYSIHGVSYSFRN
jgi:hypothetical protein